MNQETINQILQIFNNLGKAVSDGSRAIFEIYTKHAFADGVSEIVIASLLIVLMIVIGGVGLYFCRKQNDYSDIISVCIVTILIPVAMFVCGFAQSGILKVISPQYYAIQKMINQVKK